MVHLHSRRFLPRAPAPTADLAQSVVGIWLIFASFMIAYEVPAVLWNNLIAGAALFATALARIMLPAPAATRAIDILAGGWQLLAPFLFDYLRMDAFWNSTLCGVLILILVAAGRHATRAPH